MTSQIEDREATLAQLRTERFGTELEHERARPALPPPGRPVHTGRAPETWEDYRARQALAFARLAEARRDGPADSWWEEPDA